MIICLLIVGCASDSRDGNKEDNKTRACTVIGDSLCFETYNDNGEIHYLTAWPDILNLASDCIPGRGVGELMPEYYTMPEGDIILAIGTNNAIWEKPDLDVFYQAYQAVLDSIEGEVACVLVSDKAYSDVIRSLCSNVIEAAAADYKDGIHYTQKGQHKQASLVREALF